ncbi:ROK family glucokinase [Virgibacillus kekensis]|uniref:Glucokinase n=1 Tax=Virgibacillus kekensis TaxID=202261 RepID=A0ABV9DIX7_9BACI
MGRHIIGIDVGGTTVKIGIINENGNILDKWEIPTDTSNGGISILKDIWLSINKKLTVNRIDRGKIAGIGLGAPGFVDAENGKIYQAVNIGWKDINISEELGTLSNLPVYVQNDANIAVLGENWKGAGEQAQNLLAVTLGTGVGGGIIANGTVLNGENGTAGEIGHITVEPGGIPCNCGRKGCLETVASATGIVRQAMKGIESNPDSMLAAYYKNKGYLSAKDVFALANEGDALCEDIIKRTTDLLGYVIANLAVTINPSKVLIGGGVSKAGERLIQAIDKAFRKYALKRVSDVCQIKTAQLGNDAGIIGAAFLVKQNEENVTF